ncbi:MAG: sialate O-acetylesterase [Bacteroidales bacterium]|nr:sialate O-acetylesterase [Bacteroidales bacterium]
MKRYLLTILFAIFACNVYSQCEYDVFLLIGQSNMAGRGVLLESDYSIVEGVYLLNPENSAEPASNPFNKYSTIRKDLAMQQMSPAYSFGKTIFEKTGRKILLVVNARGGSTIEEWSRENPEKNYYSQAVERTKAALKMGRLIAIIWHQGEGNSEEPGDYLTKLYAFVKDLREDLGYCDAPFIAGEIAPWWLPYAINFNPIINRISEVIPNSACISAQGTKTVSNEKDPHFDRESQLLLGERYASVVLQMCYQQIK